MNWPASFLVPCDFVTLRFWWIDSREITGAVMRFFLFFAFLSLMISGCGDGLKTFPTAKVSGEVICDGQPIGNVRITFGPVASGKSLEAGKVGLATAGEDGTFVVSTYKKGDGAVVGFHNVIVAGPDPAEFPKFTCNCETDPRKVVTKVEVVKGADNEFKIVLPLKSGASSPNITAKQLQELKDDAAAEQSAKEQQERLEKEADQ
jgi:hypothetical protein